MAFVAFSETFVTAKPVVSYRLVAIGTAPMDADQLQVAS
jgi:hypothetical protein